MRAHRLLFLALISASLVPFAEGLETATLFSGTVRSGDSVAVAGMNLTIRAIGATAIQGPPTIVVAVSGQQFFLDAGECEQLRGELERFAICYDGSTYGTEHHDVQRRYDLSVRAEQLVARVVAVQRVDRTELRVGEQTAVNTTLTNVGDWKATAVSSRDVLPAGLGILIETPSCWRDGSSVVWKGELLPRQSAVCRYRIEGRVALKHSLKTEVSYNNSVELVREISAKTAFRFIAFPLVMELRLPAIIDVGSRANATLLLNNTGKQQVHIAPLAVAVPEGLRVVRLSPGFTQAGGAIRKTIQVDPLAAELLMIELEAQQFGNHTLLAQARVVIAGEATQLERSALLRVEGARPVARYYLYESAGQRRLRLDVVNPSVKRTYHRIDVAVESGLPLGTIEESFAELAPGAAHRLFDIPVPLREAPSSILATIRSVSPAGQVLSDRFVYHMPAAVPPAVSVAGEPGAERVNVSMNVSPAADDVQFVEVPAVQQPRSRALVAVASLLAVILALIFIGRRLRSPGE